MKIRIVVAAGLVVFGTWVPLYAAAADAPAEAGDECQPPDLSSVNVTPRPQLTEKWCWAASGQMVMEYLGKSVSQCEQVNAEYNRNDCCSSPSSPECLKGGWPEFTKYDLRFDRTNGTPLQWSDIKSQLAPRDAAGHCKFTPFTFTWHYKGGGGHMMVAIGYKIDGDRRLIQIIDPLPVGTGGTRFISYSEYVGIDGNSHWDDFYDVK